MLSCQQYDYIEIACMYHYPVKLTMKSGTIVQAKALDTARNEDRQECIKVLIDENEKLIILDDISMLEVTLSNPHFQSVSLN